MWIVAIGWIYVVGLMALTEPTVVAGIMTFFGYCVLPLSILFYLTGANGVAPGAPKPRPGRRRPPTRRHDAARAGTGLLQPDQAGLTAGDAVAPVRIETARCAGGA